MPEIGTSGSMSGDGKRGDWRSLKPPRPSSTLRTPPGLRPGTELKQPRRERPSAEAVSVAMMRFAQETTECVWASGRFSVEAADHPGVGLGLSLRAEARSLQ